MTTLRSLPALLGRVATLPFAQSQDNRVGCSYGLTLITPIIPGQERALTSVLEAFEPRQGSPLANLPDVQFARWVVIDRLRTKWPGAPRWPSTLESKYLLFSADLTAPPERAPGLPGTFFRDLAKHMHDECEAVWGKCLGFPGVDRPEFAEYLARSQIDIGLYYAASPYATPDDIGRALKVREQLTRFVLDHQWETTHALLSAASETRDTARQTLKDAYLRESGSWGA